jgi:hypothetical protein
VAAGFAERIRELELELEPSRSGASRLASQLEAEKAERARLAAVLDSIRSAVGATAPLSMAAPKATHTDPLEVTTRVTIVDVSDRHGAEEQNRQVPADQSAVDPGRNLKMVTRAAAEPDSVLSDCARQLLEQVEESYQNDVQSLQRPSDVVDRLVVQLRTARELFLAQCNNDEALATGEFDRQISHVLDTKGATNFGRHLGIAWYEISQPVDRVTHAVA